MKIRQIALIAASVLMLASCSTPKNIDYFQDVKQGDQISVLAPREIRIMPQDRLQITVSTQDERLNNQFNLTGASISNASTNRQDLGYLVDSEGYIIFPVIGKVYVAGLTRSEIATRIKDRLQESDLVRNPVVTVDFQNLHVTVLGEVDKPGNYEIKRDYYTVLEAIADAGDLTIFGERQNIKVLRDENGTQKEYEIDLCDANSVFTSPAFYMQQNDVVYVSPNETRQRQSTANGNTLLTPSFWLSVASFILTVTVVIVK